jgi:polyisoprenoid-binding protein YceI
VRRRWIRWLLVGLAAVVVVAIGVPFVYIHFIEGKAPAKLTLPSQTRARSSSSATTADAAASLSVSGTWNVGAGSIVGYRVHEELIGQANTAVGRTSEVWGTLTIAGSEVTSASFTVNMADVTSDESQRDNQFDGRIMDVSEYPTATFKLSAPIQLGSIPDTGEIKQYPATGQLTMHGVTRTVRFTVSAERLGNNLDVLTDISITFADWNIQNPSVGGFVTTANTGTLEVLLDLTRGDGNRPSSGTSASSGQGSGGPITVPATTVPPLSVPSKSG